MTSFRARLLVGSVLWTLGVMLVVSATLVVFFATHPQPHVATFTWFVSVPLALSGAVGAASLLVGALTIRGGIAAMEQLRLRLIDVHRGVTTRLEGAFPAEVQTLVADLNALLEARDQRIARAGMRAADLAHFLKTPLAVLARDADRAAELDEPLATSIRTEVTRMARHIDVHLSQARVAAAGPLTGVRAPIAAAVDGLYRALRRLHADRPLRLEHAVAPDLLVRCTTEDLDEILGNLLDNACTWARSHVQVTGRRDGDTIVVLVDDDGAGLEPAMLTRVLQRGVRADERRPGSGLGLAIAHDLVELYEGTLTLDRSPLGGLRVELTLPAAGR